MKTLLSTIFISLISLCALAQINFADFEHGVAKVNNITISYRTAGEGTPVVMIHGWPQHSLMWHSIAPKIVDAGYKVILPDLRGTGASSITKDGYDKKTMAEDINQLTAFLGIEKFILVGYDLGSNVAYSLAAANPDKIEKLVVMEFGLPGFGYEQFMAPSPDWDNAANWHLGLFTLPDVALMAFSGKERELLSWFFWHLAYNPNAVSNEHFEIYLNQMQRPGSLRAGIMYYASVWQDSQDNVELSKNKLNMPLLAVGGEASSGPWVAQLFQPVANNISPLVVPKAGHWLGDENPVFLADELIKFFQD